jgi:hypothetical protein
MRDKVMVSYINTLGSRDYSTLNALDGFGIGDQQLDEATLAKYAGLKSKDIPSGTVLIHQKVKIGTTGELPLNAKTGLRQTELEVDEDGKLIRGWATGYFGNRGFARHLFPSANGQVVDKTAPVDPFTGEGIGNALLSGRIAGEVITKAIQESRFDADFLSSYQNTVYKHLSSEINLSHKMQKLARYETLFNFVVNKAIKNQTLRETITCMFEDLDIRAKLKQPSFYFKLLFNKN